MYLLTRKNRVIHHCEEGYHYVGNVAVCESDDCSFEDATIVYTEAELPEDIGCGFYEYVNGEFIKHLEEKEVLPVELGGTGVTTVEAFKDMLNLKENSATQAILNLKAGNWSEGLQSVDCPGVTTNSVVIVGVSHKYYADYLDSFINCYSKDYGKLMFSCVNIPSKDIQVQVIVIEGTQGGMILNVIPTSTDATTAGPYIILEDTSFTTDYTGLYFVQAISGGGGGAGAYHTTGVNASYYTSAGGSVSSQEGLLFLPKGFLSGVTVGKGGTGGSVNTAGAAGGSSSLGDYVVSGLGGGGNVGGATTTGGSTLDSSARTPGTIVAEDSVYTVSGGSGGYSSQTIGGSGTNGVVYIKLISNKLYYLFTNENLEDVFYVGVPGNYRLVCVSGGGGGAGNYSSTAYTNTAGGRGGVNMQELPSIYIPAGVYTIGIGSGGGGGRAINGTAGRADDGGTTSFGSLLVASGSGTAGSLPNGANNAVGANSIYPQSVTVDGYTVSGGLGRTAQTTYSSDVEGGSGTAGCIVLEYLGGNTSLITTSCEYKINTSGNYKITAVSGGGGGASSWYSRTGSTGSNGGINSVVYEGYFEAGTTVAVTIGSGGAGGINEDSASSSNDCKGKDGGSTSFGSYVIASGTGTGGYITTTAGTPASPNPYPNSVTIGNYTVSAGIGVDYDENGTAGTSGCVYVEYLG